MRALILTLLIAGTAMPALAQDRGPFGMRQRERSAQSSDSGDEPARPQRAERQRSADSGSEDRVRPQRAERQRDVSEPVRVFERRERISRAPTETMQAPVVTSSAPAPLEAAPRLRVRRTESIADRIVDMRRARNGDAVLVHREPTTSLPTTTSPTTTAPTSPSRVETQHRRDDRRWSQHWRDDHRYDWRRHRDHHRSIFRFGNYWDPYGYNYRRFSIGFNIWPSYYRSSFWLNDPWMYRLPPATGRYRWVRYWDDALLVDIYTGQVVDVVYDFFW